MSSFDPTFLLSQFHHHHSMVPKIDPTAYVAPGTHIIGDVTLAAYVSVWPTAVLRADIHYIQIGVGSNVQDGAIIHLSDVCPVDVGQYVTIGHGAIVHGCAVEDECLIGMRATILDGARIGAQSIVGAGAVVTAGMVVPPGSMVLGMPAKVVRSLTETQRSQIRTWAQRYIVLTQALKQKKIEVPSP